MAAFIKANANSPIVSGERLTPSGQPILSVSDFKEADRVRYQLANGEVFVLLGADTKSAPGFFPAWEV